MAGEQLRVTEGEQRGRLLSIAAPLLLGREAPDEEGRLGGDLEISRRHARLSRDPSGQLLIEDLGSANGSFVNDERIDSPRLLEPGDVVRVGRTVMQVTEKLEELLVVTAGPAAGRRISLEGEVVLGREGSGDGKLSDDRQASRRHARVVREQSGRLVIEDLGSANGTFVNDERVQGRRVLDVGDSVRVGTTTMELRGGGQAAAPAAPVTELTPPPGPAAQAPAPPAPVAAPPTPPPAPFQRRPAAPPARRPRAPAEPAPEHVASALPDGAVFADCRVEQVIGHGDMGVVYRAEELALQRPVALKLIRPEYSRDERFRERFRRESRVIAAIDHQNVIPLFDAGDENGLLYIMMRLVEGTDLAAVIAAEGWVQPLRAARIVRQVGAALDAAHARGILHRDVKPSNVLLARHDHVYLSDFGLAKPEAARDALTRQGSIVARAEYVAPEQVLNQPVDARADIYALGCLLFEALTGEQPFAGSNVGPLAHVEAPPPSPVQLRPGLPREFDDVVRRAMAKDPDERYPSAGDLGQAALVAAGGLVQAGQWSVVATGDAAPVVAAQPAASETAAAGGNALRWAIALAGLVIVAVGMIAALNGMSTL